MFRTEFKGGANVDDKFELNYIYSLKNMESVFEFKRSVAFINGNQWFINPMGKSNHLFSFDSQSSRFKLNEFEVVSDNEKILFSMNYLNSSDFNFRLIADKVLLGQFDISSKNFQLEGTLDLDVAFKRSQYNNNLNIDGNISGFNLNKLFMGDLSFYTKGNTQNTYVEASSQ